MKKVITFFLALITWGGCLLGQSYNTANGTGALNSISGSANTATGYQSMYYSSTPWNNSAHGMQTMYSNNTGYNNCAYGSLSMFYNTSGYENAALGFQSLASNTAGIRNTAVGAYSLYSTDNTGLNTAVGYLSLYNNVTGNFNTALGDNSGLNCTASYNTYIGSGADANSTGYTNSTAIGANAIVTSSNVIRFGDNNVTTIGGPVGWTNFSDRRIKRDIKENVPGISFIKLLHPVTYHLDLSAADAITKRPVRKDKQGNPIPISASENQARAVKEKILYTGFLAQDVETAAKSIQYDFSGVDAPKNENDLYGLRYAEFVVPLVKATQELSREQDSLDSSINKIKLEIEDAMQQLTQIQAQLSANTKGTLNSFGEVSQKITAEQGSYNYLEQSVPNPSNNETRIQYHLRSKNSKAQIVLTNAIGQAIKSFPLGKESDGQITIQSAGLPSGTYYYSLHVNGKMQATKKLIIAH